MNTITCDILDIKTGLLCHQVNCKYAAGLGLAKQIKDKYPNWYKQFRNRVPKLGSIGIYSIDLQLYIIDMYAQDTYGHGLQTDYEAFLQCTNKIATLAVEYELPVFFPVGIGCGLGGGNWGIISKIIEDIIPDATLVKRRKDDSNNS